MFNHLGHTLEYTVYESYSKIIKWVHVSFPPSYLVFSLDTTQYHQDLSWYLWGYGSEVSLALSVFSCALQTVLQFRQKFRSRDGP